jgi:hypothetical protein
MNKTTTLLLLAVIVQGGMAQDYDTGIGAKIGMTPGITAKHFFTTNGALEGILTYRWEGVNLTGLAEFHIPVFDTEGFCFYYGGGLHIGVWDSGKAVDKASTGHKMNMGIDGILGLEYAFSDVPFSLGLDWKPNWNIFTDSRIIIDEISLVARYIIR